MRVTFTKFENRKLSSVSACGKSFRPKRVSDKFELINTPEPKFHYIKLKSAEKMYNTEFTPSDTEYGYYTFKTFVWDNQNGKPVEMVVKPILFNYFGEDYIILDPNRLDNKGEMEVAGKICFDIVDRSNKIFDCTMASYLNDEYSWLGLREQQIAIERMFMMRCKSIELSSVPSAYFFHKNCGYEVVKKFTKLSRKEFNEKFDYYAKKFNLDRNTTEKLFVYKKRFSGYLFDENSTCANYINYATENELSLTCCPCIAMKLSDAAKKEWKMIIQKHKIFKGRLPDKY